MSEETLKQPSKRTKEKRYVNAGKEQVQVGYYLLETKVNQYEKYSSSKDTIIAWLGMFISSVSGFQATLSSKPLNVLWLLWWFGLCVVSAIYGCHALAKYRESKQYDKTWLLNEIKGEYED